MDDLDLPPAIEAILVSAEAYRIAQIIHELLCSQTLQDLGLLLLLLNSVADSLRRIS